MKNGLLVLDRIAFIISALSSPYVIITLFSLIVIGYNSPSPLDFLYWGSLFVGLTTVIPFIYIYLQVKSGAITDLHVMVREQRSVPLILATVSTSVLVLEYYYLQVPEALSAMALATIVTSVCLIVVTQFTKVSIHTSSFTCALLSAGILAHPIYFVWSLALPLIIWARARRGRHSPTQSLIGIILGGVCTAGTYYLLGAF